MANSVGKGSEIGDGPSQPRPDDMRIHNPWTQNPENKHLREESPTNT